MHTLKSQLLEMSKTACQISEISYNYKMGFITLREMMYQIKDVDLRVEDMKSDIREEYGINDNAIYLMLEM